jgi:hypothetical protein
MLEKSNRSAAEDKLQAEVLGEVPDKGTEEELARHYDKRGADVSQWPLEAPKIRVRRGGSSTVFSFRLDSEELAELTEAARGRGVTVSAFIRDAALAETRKDSGEDGDVTVLVATLRTHVAEMNERIKQFSRKRPTRADVKHAALAVRSTLSPQRQRQ